MSSAGSQRGGGQEGSRLSWVCWVSSLSCKGDTLLSPCGSQTFTVLDTEPNSFLTNIRSARDNFS